MVLKFCVKYQDANLSAQSDPCHVSWSGAGKRRGGDPGGIVGKKWEPGNLVPSRFLGQIRKVEARLGKLAKIRKVETN